MQECERRRKDEREIGKSQNSHDNTLRNYTGKNSRSILRLSESAIESFWE